MVVIHASVVFVKRNPQTDHENIQIICQRCYSERSINGESHVRLSRVSLRLLHLNAQSQSLRQFRDFLLNVQTINLIVVVLI